MFWVMATFPLDIQWQKHSLLEKTTASNQSRVPQEKTKNKKKKNKKLQTQIIVHVVLLWIPREFLPPH